MVLLFGDKTSTTYFKIPTEIAVTYIDYDYHFQEGSIRIGTPIISDSYMNSSGSTTSNSTFAIRGFDIILTRTDTNTVVYSDGERYDYFSKVIPASKFQSGVVYKYKFTAKFEDLTKTAPRTTITKEITFTYPSPPAAPIAPTPTYEAAHNGPIVFWAYDANIFERGIEWREVGSTTPSGSYSFANTFVTFNTANIPTNRLIEVRYRARNYVGWGNWSSWTTTTAPDKPKVAPTLTATCTSSGTLSVTWAENFNTAKISIGSTDPFVTKTKGSAIYSGLTDGTTYTIEAYFSNGYGSGPRSATTCLVLGAPDAPNPPQVTVGTSSQVVLTWTPPDANGGVIDKFGVFCNELGVERETTATTYTWSGLANGTTYSFKIRAHDQMGWGAYSGTRTCIPYGIPSQPSALAMGTVDTMARALMMVANAAPNANGSPITGYNVRYAPVNTTLPIVTAMFTEISSIAPPATLVRNSQYSVTYAAINAAGTGPYSTPVTYTHIVLPPVPTIAKTLPFPDKLAFEITDSANVGEYDIVTYDIAVSFNSPTWNASTNSIVYTPKLFNLTTPSANTSFILAELGTVGDGYGEYIAVGINYEIRVRATNICGTSDWSSPIIIRPVSAPMTAPSIPSLTDAFASQSDAYTLSVYPPSMNGGSANPPIYNFYNSDGSIIKSEAGSWSGPTSHTLRDFANRWHTLSVSVSNEFGTGPTSTTRTLYQPARIIPTYSGATSTGCTVSFARPSNLAGSVTYVVNYRWGASGSSTSSFSSSNSSVSQAITYPTASNSSPYRFVYITVNDDLSKYSLASIPSVSGCVAYSNPFIPVTNASLLNAVLSGAWAGSSAATVVGKVADIMLVVSGLGETSPAGTATALIDYVFAQAPTQAQAIQAIITSGLAITTRASPELRVELARALAAKVLAGNYAASNIQAAATAILAQIATGDNTTAVVAGFIKQVINSITITRSVAGFASEATVRLTAFFSAIDDDDVATAATTAAIDSYNTKIGSPSSVEEALAVTSSAISNAATATGSINMKSAAMRAMPDTQVDLTIPDLTAQYFVSKSTIKSGATPPASIKIVKSNSTQYNTFDLASLNIPAGGFVDLQMEPYMSYTLMEGNDTMTIGYDMQGNKLYSGSSDGPTYSVGDVLQIGRGVYSIETIGTAGLVVLGTLPAAPTNVTAAAGTGQATVSWTAPTDIGSSAITAYQVCDSTGATVLATTTSGSATSMTVTGLTNGTSYSFTVRAVNTAGAGPASAPVTGVTPTSNSVPCFPAGARVLTPSGYRAVEELRHRELVITSDGRSVPILVYKTTIAKTTTNTAPYLIPAGALGRDHPAVPVRLSGNHAFQIRPRVWQKPAVLATLNHRVVQYGIGEPVTYYHLRCPNYLRDNLIVEGGLVAESYGYEQIPRGMAEQVYTFNQRLGGFTRISSIATTQTTATV